VVHIRGIAVFAIGGKVIENIVRWPHLGHVFNAHLTAMIS